MHLACASAHFDRSLYCPKKEAYHKTVNRNCGCTGWFESSLDASLCYGSNGLKLILNGMNHKSNEHIHNKSC